MNRSFIQLLTIGRKLVLPIKTFDLFLNEADRICLPTQFIFALNIWYYIWKMYLTVSHNWSIEFSNWFDNKPSDAHMISLNTYTYDSSTNYHTVIPLNSFKMTTINNRKQPNFNYAHYEHFYIEKNKLIRKRNIQPIVVPSQIFDQNIDLQWKSQKEKENYNFSFDKINIQWFKNMKKHSTENKNHQILNQILHT